MGVTAAIVSGVAALGSATYGVVAGKKAAKNAAVAQASAIETRPNPQADQFAAIQKAQSASAVQRKKTASAHGYQSTILTGPAGIPSAAATTPPASKTLLGL